MPRTMSDRQLKSDCVSKIKNILFEITIEFQTACLILTLYVNFKKLKVGKTMIVFEAYLSFSLFNIRSLLNYFFYYFLTFVLF